MGEQLAMTLGDRTREPVRFCRSVLAIRDPEIPTIAPVNGHAMGAGFALALVRDLRLAAENARLGLSFVKIGPHPGMNSCYFLSRMVGTAKALELLWRGEAVSAPEARRLGLANRLVKARAIGEAARGLARELAAGPAVALRLKKSALYLVLGADLDSILERGSPRAGNPYRDKRFQGRSQRPFGEASRSIPGALSRSEKKGQEGGLKWI